MTRLTISDFKREIRSLHGAHARIVGAETARLSGEGEAVEEILVLIFAFLDHPKAHRCYAWERDGRVVVVLHSAEIDSPQAAIHSKAGRRLRLVEGGQATPSVSWSFRTTVGELRIKPSRTRSDRF